MTTQSAGVGEAGGTHGKAATLSMGRYAYTKVSSYLLVKPPGIQEPKTNTRISKPHLSHSRSLASSIQTSHRQNYGLSIQQRRRRNQQPSMCFYDIVRFICTGEQSTLAERCPLAGNCVVHVRRVLHSTAVCDLCAAAWSMSALSDDDCESAVAITSTLDDQSAFASAEGYCDIEGNDSAAQGQSSDAVVEELLEGVFQREITMPISQQERSRPASFSGNQVQSLTPQQSTLIPQFRAASANPSSPAPLPRRHSF